jgi:hypothetical protein
VTTGWRWPLVGVGVAVIILAPPIVAAGADSGLGISP